MELDFMICRGKSILALAISLFIMIITQTGWSMPGRLKGDSVKKSFMVITPRMNSTGHFPFSGSLLNYHLNADINTFYERNHFGFFIFKSFDLADNHSYVNYLQPGLFATVNLNDRLKVRGFFGYIFNQTTHFRDHDSDYYLATAFYFNLSPKIQLENTVLYYDYNINKKLANRFVLTWTQKKFSTSLYVWERIVFEEEQFATSVSLAVTFPTLKLSDRFSLKLTSSYWRYLTSTQPSYALKEGLLFTLAVPVEVLRK